MKRRALAAAPASLGKTLRKVIKHALYILVSAVISHSINELPNCVFDGI